MCRLIKDDMNTETSVSFNGAVDLSLKSTPQKNCNRGIDINVVNPKSLCNLLGFRKKEMIKL